MQTENPYLALNTRLLEAFGRLEKLCSECYGELHGVTCYIQEMESLQFQAARIVPQFCDDLLRLKAVRHKRNKLAHADGQTSFLQPLAEQTDIDFCEQLYQRILHQQDPLAVYALWQSEKAAATPSRSTRVDRYMQRQQVISPQAATPSRSTRVDPMPLHHGTARARAQIFRKSLTLPKVPWRTIALCVLLPCAALFLLLLFFRCRPL